MENDNLNVSLHKYLEIYIYNFEMGLKRKNKSMMKSILYKGISMQQN